MVSSRSSELGSDWASYRPPPGRPGSPGSPGGRVNVEVHRAEDTAILRVRDTGPGIPPDRLPHVFDRFYKADSSRAGPGSGLGLAIALENARLLGGDLAVWSEVGRGTRFTLRLPVT